MTIEAIINLVSPDRGEDDLVLGPALLFHTLPREGEKIRFKGEVYHVVEIRHLVDTSPSDVFVLAHHQIRIRVRNDMTRNVG